MQKSVPNRKTRFPQKKEKQKKLQCFLFQNVGYRTPKSSPRKVREKSGKIKFHTKNRHSVPSSSTAFVEVKIILFTFFWPALFVILDVLSLFHIVPYLKLVVWISYWCHFCEISIKFVSSRVLWRPPSRRGSCQVGYQESTTWELQAWDMKTPVSIMGKHCFWKGALTDNFIYFFCSFD